MNQIYIGLGTNLGDKAANLDQAIRLIHQKIGWVRAKSAVYETAPWGIQDQPGFLNQVILVESNLQPEEALECLLDIELKMGRERRQKWGSRLIDLDILFYDQLVIRTPRLILPHPFLQDRNFVLVPLREIAPDFMHPVFHQTIDELTEKSTDPLKVSPMLAET